MNGPGEEVGYVLALRGVGARGLCRDRRLAGDGEEMVGSWSEGRMVECPGGFVGSYTGGGGATSVPKVSTIPERQEQTYGCKMVRGSHPFLPGRQAVERLERIQRAVGLFDYDRVK